MPASESIRGLVRLLGMVAKSEMERVVEAIRGVVAPKGSPRVAGHLIDAGVDEADDPAVFITVLLADETTSAEWISTKLDPIAEAVRAAVRGTGTVRWPYVSFARLSDAGGTDVDRPEWTAAG